MRILENICLVLALFSGIIFAQEVTGGTSLGERPLSGSFSVLVEFQDVSGSANLSGSIDLRPISDSETERGVADLSFRIKATEPGAEAVREEFGFELLSNGRLKSADTKNVYGHSLGQWLQRKRRVAPRPSIAGFFDIGAEYMTAAQQSQMQEAVNRFNEARFQGEFWMPLMIAANRLSASDDPELRIERRSTIALPLADELNLQQKWIIQPLDSKTGTPGTIRQLEVDYQSLMDGTPGEHTRWRVAYNTTTHLPVVAKMAVIDPVTDFTSSISTYKFTWE